MMESPIVSFEMAQKLKEAGFPQTVYEGQIRYSNEGEFFKVFVLPIKNDKSKIAFAPFIPEHSMWAISDALLGDVKTLFAPTIENLLRELPMEYRNLKLKPVKVVFNPKTGNKMQIDDADAYAQMWLDRREMKE